jgi:hypothetical protein
VAGSRARVDLRRLEAAAAEEAEQGKNEQHDQDDPENVHASPLVGD